MLDEQRFALGARGDPTAEPGLVRDEVGRVYVIAPDGTRSLLPGNGGSQPFVPTDLNGQVGMDYAPTVLMLWLDSSDAATIHEADNAGFVSKWDDKSGLGNDATQATEEAQPATGAATIDSKNALTFDGAATFMDTALVLPGASASDCFVAVVFKAGAVDLDSFNYAVVSNAIQFLRLNNSADDPQLQSASFGLSCDPAEAHIASLGSASALSTVGLRIDVLATQAPGDQWNDPSTLQIGAQGGADQWWLGEIAEVVAVQGALDPQQQQQLFDYLAAKWGITL